MTEEKSFKVFYYKPIIIIAYYYKPGKMAYTLALERSCKYVSIWHLLYHTVTLIRLFRFMSFMFTWFFCLFRLRYQHLGHRYKPYKHEKGKKPTFHAKALSKWSFLQKYDLISFKMYLRRSSRYIIIAWSQLIKAYPRGYLCIHRQLYHGHTGSFRVIMLVHTEINQ